MNVGYPAQITGSITNGCLHGMPPRTTMIEVTVVGYEGDVLIVQ